MIYEGLKMKTFSGGALMPSPRRLSVGGSWYDANYELSSSEDLLVFIHFLPRAPSSLRVKGFLSPIQRIINEFHQEWATDNFYITNN